MATETAHRVNTTISIKLYNDLLTEFAGDVWQAGSTAKLPHGLMQEFVILGCMTALETRRKQNEALNITQANPMHNVFDKVTGENNAQSTSS